MLLSINIARFHPLLVHLPIGILIFAAVLEVLQWRRKNQELDSAIRAALVFGFLSALFAGASGWLLSQEGGYDAKMLWQHQWSGIGLTIFSLFLYLSKTTRFSFLKKIYTPLFMFVLLLLCLTGHFGGNLTHGANYLFSKAVDESIIVTDIEKEKVFATIVEPIFKAKCNSCHNASKAKGELIMTTHKGILAGGKTGLMFNFDQVEESELLKRIHLPEEEKKHMPPKGKKQLTEDEKKLLLWWIENKACVDCLVETMKNRETVESILKKYQSQDLDLAKLKVDPIREETLKNLRKMGLNVDRLSEESSLLIVTLSNKNKLDRSAIKSLKRIGENIVELNLANAKFPNHFPALFKAMPHLKKLQVQHTNIDNQAIEGLRKMKYLESLNIYGTTLTDGIIETLKAIPSLKKLYCWQTKITAPAILDLQIAKPQMEINYKIEETIFGDSKLNPPEIIAKNEIFRDSLVISFATNLKKAKFFYTLDGSEVDTMSLVAPDSFYLRESAVVKVIAQAKSWGISSVAEQNFIQSKIKIKSAKLRKAPNDNYKAEGSRSLIDLKKGSEAIMEGNWLGYQGEHLEATLELANKEEIDKVLVSCLSAPLSWIFFPNKIKVWTSIDGKQYILQKEESYAPPLSTNEQSMKYFELKIKPSIAKLVKVKIFSLLKNPDWHSSAGEACWIFVDEILVE